MPRPDDSSLNRDDLRAVEKGAYGLLDRADAWHRFPVPIDDILAAANVQVAPTSAFEPAAILAFVRNRTASTALRVKKALSKVLGLYDPGAGVIHVDQSVVKTKQTFLKLHETAHHDLPTHRRSFALFQDCDKTLAPTIADQFEREANNYARLVLFKGPTFSRHAADYSLGIKVPLQLAKEFGSSAYAALREYVRTHERRCAAIILNPVEVSHGGRSASVRRVEMSPAWDALFDYPANIVSVTPSHQLWRVIPRNKMSAPTHLSVPDRNGDLTLCVAEAFRTPYNIFILIYV